MRKSFPLKQGDLFERRGISGGLEALRKLYTSEGYIDFFTIPNISFTGSGIHMNIEVNEGPQYHMGRLDVFAKKELADRFRAAWDLREGKIYDAGYPAKFVDEHHDILPTGFTASEIKLVRNCPDAVADVRVIVDQIDAAAHPAKPVGCEDSSGDNP